MDETYYVPTWDRPQLTRVLETFVDRINESELDGLLRDSPSLFAIRCQVARVRFRGDKGIP